MLTFDGTSECGPTSTWLACVVAGAEQGVPVGVGSGTTAQSLARLHPIAGSLVPDEGDYTQVNASTLRRVIDSPQGGQSDYVDQIRTFITTSGALSIVVGPVPALEVAPTSPRLAGRNAAVHTLTPAAEITVVIATRQSSSDTPPVAADALLGDPAVEEVGEVEEEGDDFGKPYYIYNGERHVVDKAVPEDKYVSLVHMALDDEYAAQYVEMIETYEAVDRNKEPMAPQSIVELARDIQELGQLVPILVRREKDGFVGIDGGRRCAAILYLHAKSKVLRQEKAKDAPSRVYPATVLATTDACKQGEVFLHSLKANFSRKEFTPIQEGRVYHELLQQINPETSKKWTMKDAAETLGVEYGTFRNREALWRPYDKETKRGLTETDREKVVRGEMGVTAAARKALGERHYAETGEVNRERNRGLPLNEIQRRFDETAEKNYERRKAFAECMGFDGERGYKQACKESEERIARQDELDMKRRNGKG